MKKTIIIVLIAVLAVVAICLGTLIAVWQEPVDTTNIDIHTNNSIIETLGIQRSNTKLERLFAITTYQGASSNDELISDIIRVGQVSSFEYLELNDKGDDYLLITPFEINGKLEIGTLAYDPYNEFYKRDKIIFRGNEGERLPDNYSLLIRYTRPAIPEIEIKLIQEKNGEEQTATYQVVNAEGVTTTQRIKDDIAPGTDELGLPLKMLMVD